MPIAAMLYFQISVHVKYSEVREAHVGPGVLVPWFSVKLQLGDGVKGVQGLAKDVFFEHPT